LSFVLGTALLAAAPVRARAATNPLESLFSADHLRKAKQENVSVAPGRRSGSISITFGPDAPGTVVIPIPQTARDWTLYETLAFEMRSSSTILWELQFQNQAGEKTTFRVQPYQNVPVKVAIPIDYLTRRYMDNRQFGAYWLSNWGGPIDMTGVQSIAIRMAPNRSVVHDLGPLDLSKESVRQEIHLEKPVVDEFGQWMREEWPGKVHSAAELKAAWANEDRRLKQSDDFGFSPFGGWKARQERKTGFFHAAAVDGRWWLVDPEGYLFFSSGMDCVGWPDLTQVAGREVLFSKLPPGTTENVDFYAANAALRYGSAGGHASAVPKLNWKAQQDRRLKAWGFNTVGNWSDKAMFRNSALPFVTNVAVGRSDRSWQGFPDVYSDEYVRSAERDAGLQCARFKNEPYLIGYFIGNEPRWPYRNLIDLILKDAQSSATQEFVKKALAQSGDSPEARNNLLETISRTYFQLVVNAIRRADPNHMVLGIRWAGRAPDPVLRANDVFDVFSINVYRFNVPEAQVKHVYELVKRPVLIGEFHFGAVERGLAPALVMVKDQAERGVAFEYYVEHAAALPPVVGTHYFQYVDEPVTGRFDGENYNLGFLDVTDQPYPEMVSFAKATHRRIYQVHAGILPPAERQAKVR
jgi:hypothetical protein